MTTLNPEHPHAEFFKGNDQWQKIACFLVMKAGGQVTITIEDINAAGMDLGLAVDMQPDHITFTCIRPETAELLAKTIGRKPHAGRS